MTTPAAIILGSAMIALGVALGAIASHLEPRYEFATVAGGRFIRLDRVTGEIQSCRPNGVGSTPAEGEMTTTPSWQCAPIPGAASPLF